MLVIGGGDNELMGLVLKAFYLEVDGGCAVVALIFGLEEVGVGLDFLAVYCDLCLIVCKCRIRVSVAESGSESDAGSGEHDFADSRERGCRI